MPGRRLENLVRERRIPGRVLAPPSRISPPGAEGELDEARDDHHGAHLEELADVQLQPDHEEPGLCGCRSRSTARECNACMYACTHVRMYACTHVRMCACTHVRMSACAHVRMYACAHVRMYACTHVRMYACAHVSLSLSLSLSLPLSPSAYDTNNKTYSRIMRLQCVLGDDPYLIIGLSDPHMY